MAEQVESALRGPQAFELAHRAVEDMERRGIWPTPLNFELWIHMLGEPEGDLAREIERLSAARETITEGISEVLAAAYLPKARLDDQIRDAGDRLNRELASVTEAIKAAHVSSEQYGQTLAGAGRELAGQTEPAGLGKLVKTLSNATRDVQQDNRSLEQRLAESTAEVSRLKVNLERVRRDATTDGLTGLANRKAFDDEFARACDEARKKRQPLTLAVLDIDHFKKFNDTWGHQLQLAPTITKSIDIRVTASLSASASKLASNVLKFNVTPYAIPPKVAPPASGQLFMVGDATAGGWNNPVPTPSQQFTKISATLYEITVSLTGGKEYLFLPVNGDWSHKYAVQDKTLSGLSVGGDFGYDKNDNFPAPAASGTYKIQVDFQRGKFTVTKQ